MKVSRRAFVQALLASGAGCAAPRAFASGARSAIRMQNTASRAGLDFVLRNDSSGRKYQVETLPGGVGVIDFDNDGWPDIYCTNGASLPGLSKNDPKFFNRLYRNNRDGTFTDVSQKAGVTGKGYDMGVAVADYDNDGNEDMFIAGVHGNTLFHNNGDGTFTDVTAKAGLTSVVRNGQPLWAIAAAWVDYDNDGFLDLIVSNYCDWTAGSDPVCGGITAETRTYCHPDMYRAEPMLVYHNNGNGTFTDVSREVGLADVLGKGMGLAIADYDGDGRQDIFIANDNARNLLIRNAAGKLKEVGVNAGVAYNGDGRQISGMGADFRDYDGDGRPDIVMTGLKGETFELFRNLGDGSFEDASASSGLLALSRGRSGWGCAFLDLDNDGVLDLFVANGGLDSDQPQANAIFRNVKGKFVDASSEAGEDFAVPRLHRGLAWADFDNDGRLDVVVTALNGPTELWMNRTDPQNWLQLKLVGTKSNRSAIGARVTCHSGSRTQVTTVTNSVGYASASDLRVHFGLGSDNAADVEILWPSGMVQRLEKLPVNQRKIVTEPEKMPALDPTTVGGKTVKQ